MALVLGTRVGETVYLDLPDGTVGTVTLLSAGSDRVRLGFDFPQAVRVYRAKIAPAGVKARSQPTENV